MMRSQTAQLRGSTDGTLFTDLTRPVRVPATGDVELLVRGTASTTPVAFIEIVLQGCQNMGVNA